MALLLGVLVVAAVLLPFVELCLLACLLFVLLTGPKIDMTTLRFAADDVCPALVLRVLSERGWMKLSNTPQQQQEPSVWWKLKRFLPEEHSQSLRWANCRLNHWPHSMRLTNKNDLRKELGHLANAYGFELFSFAPLTYCLPGELPRWCADQQKNTKNPNLPNPIWICKPVGLSQGRGIFLTKESELPTLDWKQKSETVVQRYIADPLLVGGHKFDMRLYVLVDSLAPLRVRLFDDGLARFAAHKYDPNDLSDRFSHLTNCTINKEDLPEEALHPSPELDHAQLAANVEPLLGPGCKSKWRLTVLRQFLRTTMGSAAEEAMWTKVEQLVVLTCAGLCSDTMSHEKRFFELFGFDVLLDSQCNPHLLEVNFSPSLGCDCTVDEQVKVPMLHSLFNSLNITGDKPIITDQTLKFKQLYPLSSSEEATPKARESATAFLRRLTAQLQSQKK